jgi:hypothetical protein
MDGHFFLSLCPLRPINPTEKIKKASPESVRLPRLIRSGLISPGLGRGFPRSWKGFPQVLEGVSPGLGRGFPRSWEAPSSFNGLSLNHKCFVAFSDRRLCPGEGMSTARWMRRDSIGI